MLHSLEDLFWDMFIFIMGVAAFLVVLFAAAIMFGALITWSYPWTWVNQPHYPYPRQVTNITYVHAGGVDAGARIKLLKKQSISPTTWATPTCPSSQGDLFNPTGGLATQTGSGWSLTFFAGGSQQTLDLPHAKVHLVPYGGKQAEVSFTYNKVVFYYDRLYDSLWTNTGADGPKDMVINCMRQNSLAQRMLVGLKYATVFEPVSAQK